MSKLKKILAGLAIAGGIAVVGAGILPYNSIGRGLIGQRSVSEDEVVAVRLRESGDRYAAHCSNDACEFTHDEFSHPLGQTYRFFTSGICSGYASQVCIDDECKVPNGEESKVIAEEGLCKICRELDCNEMCDRQMHIKGNTPERDFFRNVDNGQR